MKRKKGRMDIEPFILNVESLSVEVWRKNIKNLHLSVCPPDGHVRISAPLRYGPEAIRLAVAGKLPWIQRKRALFTAQERQSRREMVDGEKHFFLGRKFMLRLIYAQGITRVEQKGRHLLEMRVPFGTAREEKAEALWRWYRRELKERIPPIIEKWQKKLGVKAEYWGVKRMKTKWGSCNTVAKRIWINLELVKKPPRCLDFVILHELCHVRVRDHGSRFTALMDTAMPDWRSIKALLDVSPLAHEEWDD